MDAHILQLEQDLTEIDWLPRLSVRPLTEFHHLSNMVFDDTLPAASCRNTDKPPFSYGELIKMAISSTAEMQMTLAEIYRWVSNNFDYYKKCRSGSWKNSIRHNLSLSKHFIKVPRGPDDPGKGCYWSVDTVLANGSKSSNSQNTKRKSLKTRMRQTIMVSPYFPETPAITPSYVDHNITTNTCASMSSDCICNSFAFRKNDQLTQTESSVEAPQLETFEDSTLLRSIMEFAGITHSETECEIFHHENAHTNNVTSAMSQSIALYSQPMGFSSDLFSVEEDFNWDSLFN